jgi:hypothetical protein
MQGKKVYQEKLFSNFQLSQRAPEGKFLSQVKRCFGFIFFVPTDQALLW